MPVAIYERSGNNIHLHINSCKKCISTTKEKTINMYTTDIICGLEASCIIHPLTGVFDCRNVDRTLMPEILWQHRQETYVDAKTVFYINDYLIMICCFPARQTTIGHYTEQILVGYC